MLSAKLVFRKTQLVCLLRKSYFQKTSDNRRITIAVWFLITTDEIVQNIPFTIFNIRGFLKFQLLRKIAMLAIWGVKSTKM